MAIYALRMTHSHDVLNTVIIKWVNETIGHISGSGGSAIARAVSRHLPTTVARVRPLVWSSGICDGQSDTVAGFLQALRFPLPVLIPPTAGTIGQLLAD
jgi:hypothetical protein